MERTEPAYKYTCRELGNWCEALVPENGTEDLTEEELKYCKMPPNPNSKPHKAHQVPFNCCSETAATGTHGSSIELRRIPKEKLPELLFGPSKAKQKPLMLDENGEPKVISISTRSGWTDAIDSVFISIIVFTSSASLDALDSSSS